MSDTISLTTNTGSITAILQLLLLNPSKVFKPLTRSDHLGTAAHASQLVRKAMPGYFFPFCTIQTVEVQ